MLNFAVARRRLCGLMITASHNPKHYNGIEVIDGGHGGPQSADDGRTAPARTRFEDLT